MQTNVAAALADSIGINVICNIVVVTMFSMTTMFAIIQFPPCCCYSTKEVKELYGELVNEYAFSVDQLLELSGFSCAVAIAKVWSCSVDTINVRLN